MSRMAANLNKSKSTATTVMLKRYFFRNRMREKIATACGMFKILVGLPYAACRKRLLTTAAAVDAAVVPKQKVYPLARKSVMCDVIKLI